MQTNEIDDLPQIIADNLVPLLPKNWSIFTIEVVLRSGFPTVLGRHVVRVVVGSTPYEVQEVSGMGATADMAIGALYEEARKIQF